VATSPTESNIYSPIERTSSAEEVLNNSDSEPDFSKSPDRQENDKVPENNNHSLPIGWDIDYSDTGRMFFIDLVNKKTTWLDPRTSKPSPQPHFEFESRIGSLAAGWEERIDRDGRRYFVDHNHKRTQWEDPRLDKFVISYYKDFKQKFELHRELFSRHLQSESDSEGGGQLLIEVSSQNVLQDTYNTIMNLGVSELLRRT
jgi:E3 ubiquitin-protein ligase NEDD4